LRSKYVLKVMVALHLSKDFWLQGLRIFSFIVRVY
jgi:hypothetical protein